MSGEGEGKLDMSGMEKVEALSAERFRNLRGIWYAIFILFTGLGIFLSINQIFSIKFFINFVILDNSYLYLMLGLFVSMVFLVFPATSRSPRDRIPWYDICLFLITISICIYYSATGRQNLNEGWEFWPIPEAITDGFLGWISLAVKDLFAGRLPDVIVLKFLGWISMAFVGWALVMETVRRTGGTAIFIIFGLFSLYPVYADAFFIPEIFSGRAQDLWSTARYHLMSEESVLGIPMTVFGTLIVGFIIFGVTLQSTGGGRFFINLAFALLGGVRGGPAKVAIVASGMFGSLSGSVITNVLTTGAMTIPAMKRTGYPARYAAGIEACASTGGVLMPPVMGATAFVMASFLDVSYLTVAAAAVIPSLLYFFGLFVQIDSFAARNQIKGLPAAELPSVGETLREGWYYVIAFLLLIVLLVYLKREAHAPFFATAALLALSQLGKLTFRDVWYWIIISAVMAFVAVVLVSVKFPPPWTTNAPVLAGIALLLFTQIPSQVRIGINDLYGYLFTNGKLLAELVSILAAVGLIIGGLMVTGMAGTFSGDLVRVAGGNMYLLLAMGALTSFILGIGMTVTAAYIFLAIVLAPGLVELGMDKVAVHLFILYWGMISFITPPVALGAYAAASLAGAKPMQTGFEAMRLGSIIYFLPFFFVLNPALIFHAPWLEVLMELVTALIGITLLASGLQGYLVGVGPLFLDWASAAARIFLIVGGLLLAYPEMISNGVGILLLVPAVLLGKLAGRDNLPAPEVSGTG